MKSPTFPSRSDFQSTYAKVTLPLSWPTSIPSLVPHRLRRKLRSKIRSRQSPSSTFSTLQKSLSPLDSLSSLRTHRWSLYDLQYLFLAILVVFSLCIIPGSVLFRVGVPTVILLSVAIPASRQFWLPFWPIGIWLLFYYACGFIPSSWRFPIWVRVLPALENIFYGANLSNILSAHQNTFLDIMAWLPYGIMHFGAPAVCSAIMWFFAAPGTVPVFAKSFGYLNIIGVLIQLIFPCSPPWYENLYGLAPANYSIHGSPAGLARIDELFGIALYTPGFTSSPMVFGAFPSMHAGSATIEALFMGHVFPKLKPLFIAYTLWLWWATMYLSHHYAVDLVGGSLIAGVIFYVAKARFLPRQQPDKTFRWDYDYAELGEEHSEKGYALADLHPGHIDADEWTVGSSSSISSGSISPRGNEESQSLWEGETLASDSEAQR